MRITSEYNAVNNTLNMTSLLMSAFNCAICRINLCRIVLYLCVASMLMNFSMCDLLILFCADTTPSGQTQT